MPDSRSVSWRASPPPSGSSHSCGESLPDDRNASQFPSGDHLGDWSLSPGVSWPSSPVPRSASQMARRYALASRSSRVVTKASRLPSGWKSGSPTSTIRKRSSAEIRVGACAVSASCADGPQPARAAASQRPTSTGSSRCRTTARAPGPVSRPAGGPQRATMRTRDFTAMLSPRKPPRGQSAGTGRGTPRSGDSSRLVHVARESRGPRPGRRSIRMWSFRAQEAR